MALSKRFQDRILVPCVNYCQDKFAKVFKKKELKKKTKTKTVFLNKARGQRFNQRVGASLQNSNWAESFR